MPAVTQIHIYPIKSCRGVSVESAQVEARGLARDRRYMLVDANSRFVSQRQHPRMALLEVAIDDDGLDVRAPGMPALRLPRQPRDFAECEVRIWGDIVQASLGTPEVNLWFSEYMGFACGIVYLAEHQHRPVTNASAEFDDEVSFADAAPLLLISEPSLEELNRRLAEPVTMQRFRPNLVVSADAPNAEDEWRAIDIGSARFEVAWPCSRCILTTIDPLTGRRSPEGEPIRTLKTYRQVGRSVMFGQNLLPRALGTVRVGEELIVEQRESGHEERNQGQSSA